MQSNDEIKKPTPEENEKYIAKLAQVKEIQLEIKHGLFRGNYLSKIMKMVKGQEVFLSLPESGGNIVSLWPHTMVYINFFMEDEPGAVYTFNDKIVNVFKNEKPEHFTILFPKEIIRIQRRSFVRVDTSIPVNFKLFKLGESPIDENIIEVEKTGYMLDLSGGGIFLRSPYKIEKDQFILLDFELDKEKYSVISKAVRVIPIRKGRKTYYKYGVIFDSENFQPSVRRAIISYVFELERQLIRKKKEEEFKRK